MSNIGYRIVRNINRPSKALISAFEGMQVATIDDCMNRTAALDSRIKPVNQANLIGPAFTLDISGGDNLLFYIALDMAKEGDVIVVSGGGYTERAVCGEIMARYAESKKLGGIVVDGAIRDFEVLSNMDFPVFALGTSPNGPFKNGPGEINFPISVGGQVVSPGDIVIGDADGIVVVKPDEAEELLEKVKKTQAKEAFLLEQIKQGKGLDVKWAYDKVSESNCEFI